jgi:hypothetical protein
VQGWTTLIIVILFFAGVQLISVGVLGEYVARIFGEVKNRPLYLVRRQAGQGLAESNEGTGVSGADLRVSQVASSPLRKLG